MTNVVVPMAGAGTRFADAGHQVPKFLIDVAGMPMIQRAMWGSGIGGKIIYVVQSTHNKEYNLSELLPALSPDLEVLVLEVGEVTEGAAATVLVAKDYIDNEDLLVICDSDGVVEWKPNDFLIDAGESRNLDGSIAVFTSSSSAFSYAKTSGGEDLVQEVVEKDVISDNACAGVYYWRKGSDFVRYAEKMISENKRVNGEFYVAPVYNEAIADDKKVGVYVVDKFHSMGTPEDLSVYMETVVPWVDESIQQS
jgi:dTDP-glucose pyrophosphorylase